MPRTNVTRTEPETSKIADSSVTVPHLPQPKLLTVTSSIYHQIKRDIMRVNLAPGEKLRIESLRNRYNVGGTPIREALSRLISEKLVTFQDQRGFRVADVSLEDLRELTRSRCLLNSIVLKEAIALGDEAWEENIIVSFHRMNRVARDSKEDFELWDRHHRIFHDALIAACNARWLRDLAGEMFDAAGRYRNLSQIIDTSRNIESEHQRIMEATVKRESENATKFLNEHALKTTESIITIWDSKQEPQ